MLRTRHEKSIVRKRTVPSNLLQYARENRDEGFFNDLTVIAGSETILANRMVLASNSKYFEKMFRTKMKERYSNSVDVQGTEGKALKSIIDYFYTESIEINDTNVTNLLAAADYLQIDDVKDFCFDFLQSIVSPGNSISVLNALNLYGNEVLADQAIQFICSNLEVVSQTNDFKSFPKVELISFLSKLKKEQGKATSIYTALVSWIKHDEDERQKEFTELFGKLLDLSNFPTEFIEDELLNEKLITDNPNCYKEVLKTFAKLLRDKSASFSLSKLHKNIATKGNADLRTKDAVNAFTPVTSDVAPPPTQAVKVMVEVGDILSQRTDVILNTAGPDFDLSMSMLSQLLVKNAGQQIVKECAKPSKCVSSGFKFRITNAGALNCQYVAHLVVDSNRTSNQPLLQQIPMDLLAVFKAVNKLEQNSIAIPAIGTGNASLRPKDAVNAIRSAIEMYEQTKPEFLTVIKIVIFETKLYSDFECLTTTETVVPVIETPPTFDTPSTSRYDQSSYLNPTPHRVKESIPRTMMLKLCSKHEQTNAKVMREIDFKFETKYKKKSISHISPKLKIGDFLDSLRQNSDVKIREENGLDGLQVTVSGFEDDVNDICDKLIEFLKTARE